MGLGNGLFSGVSGLNSNGTALSVIGNNIANVNTVGFKKSTVTFADILSATGVQGGSVGRGSFVQDVSTDFSQGSFQNTTSVLDLGIDGNGFFQVASPSGSRLYTRAGKFSVNSGGLVVTPDGYTLQGYVADGNGNLSATIGDMNVSSTQSAPNSTTSIEINTNLDSRESLLGAFDVTNPANTSNFSTAITVYDSLGNAHPVTVYFRKSIEAPAGNTWEWFGVVSGSDNANSALDEIQANGTLTFTNTGALNTESAITYPTGGFDFTGGAALNQAIAFDFGRSIAEGTTGLVDTIQFGSPSSVVFQSQDGYSAGSLQSISVNQDGVITGLFTNGQTRVLSQIVLAIFNSDVGLFKLGDNKYGESFDSGQPIVGAPNAAGRGRVLSSSLELSNVDLAEEFVTLIMAQRGFQANSRIITVTDEMMAELVNLKR